MRLLLLATACLVVTVSANYRARFDKRAFQYTHYHGGNEIQITVYPNDQNVREGRDVTFDCRARSDDNTVYPSVRWTKVGGPLPRSASESNGRLTISPASQSDSGQYVCIASHEGRTVEAYAQLHVQSYGPQELQGQSSSGGRCMADEKTCQNGECVKSDYVCDGEYDCRDRTDEQNCPPARSCEPNEFKCSNSRCVQKMWLCDGDDDCGDNSDEANCGQSRPGDVCQPTEYKCGDGRQCVPQSFQCDGTNDCRDGSDEVGCVQPTVVEPPETRKDVPVGQTFKLNCRAVAVPEPYINWRLNWGPVCDPPRCVQTSEGGVGTLTVNNAQEIDQGAYTCEAINVKGRVLATPDCIVRIVNIPAPTPPPQPQTRCNAAGSIDPHPDPRTGQCRCKLYVRGPLCDQCEAGSFYLHEKAPQGCLRCFCSGVTKQCQSSRWYRTKEKLTFTGGDAQGVTISDFQEHDVQTNPNFEFGIRGMLTYTGPQDETVYWRLPSRFLGDKVTAYGGTLSFEFQYSGSGSLRNDALVVLKGNEITLVYRPQNRGQIVADRPNTISIDMYETSWEREDGQPVTREHLLMALADLESFLIRAVHVDNQYSSSLGDVTFEVAVERDTQEGIALEVEDCACPPGYVGLSCQDCAPGYERSGGGLYLGTCVPKSAAQCSAGAVSPTAGPDGRCQCKAYVTGPNCDQCITNSFHFSADNPQGCIPCFCSGVTQDCSGSHWYRHAESVDFSRGGRNVFEVTTSDARSPYSPASRAQLGSRELTFSSFGEARGQTLYWKLAEPFLGNRVTSYGGYIKYVFRFSGTGSPNSEPDVILRGNDITLHYIHRNPPRSDQENTVEITMFEDRWQRVDGQPATREHLLMTLADLDTFLIKMSYVDRTDSSSLLSVEMQYANERDSGLARANAVEMCRCPPGYIGTSCEDCAPGYSRSGGGLYLGLCERCECHGHATECDLEYGYCIDCQHNTEGDQCERCKPGFTGDARRGTPNDCQPLQTRAPCICYNHSPRGCDSHGRCLLCEHNTEGEHCENCKRGYYGRATDGTPYDCTPCPCPGASECYLDAHGEVTCRNCPAGFTGRLCDECAPGYTEDRADPSRKCTPIGPVRVQIVPPKVVSVPVGQTARWQCDIVGDRPPAYNLVWTKVGSPSLPPNARDYNGQLTITNVQESDVGQYRCTATTPHHIATDDGELRISEPEGSPPQPIVDPSFQTVRKGDPARITCTASGDPPPRISWGYRVPGGPLRGDVVESNGVLSIPSTTMEDSGDYYCTASNPHGTVNSPPARIDVTEQEVPPTARVEPRVWNGQPGETHEFRCITTGHPPPQITWSGPNGGRLPDGVEDAGNGVLRLSNARMDMNGEYECVAVNVVGQASDTGVANVGPSLTIRTTPAGPRIRLTVGEPLKVKCEAIGSPEPTVEWIHDPGPERGDLPDDFVPVAFDDIYITHPAVGLGNIGVYTCRGSNSQATASKDIYLEVVPLSAVATVSILSGHSQTFVIGQPAELVCTSTGSQLVDRVEWVRLGDALPRDAKQEDGILRFSPFEGHYAGDYECHGYRAGEQVGSASVKVNVRPGPGVRDNLLRPTGPIVRVSEPSVRVVQEGGSIVLTCDVSDHKGKKVNYEWALLREGTMTRLSSTEPTLTISNANPATDFGVYRCEVETADEGELLGSATAAVVIGHASQSNAVSSPFDLNANAELICPVYIVPGATVTWTKDGGALPAKATPKGHTLQITDFDEEDQGIYNCRVTINQNSVNGYVKATIWVPETIIQVLTEVSQENLNLGETAWFDCKVQGDPSATVTWSKEGSERLPDNSEVKGNRLLLTSLREDNSGIYKCRADTKAGPLETRTVLNIGSAKRKRKELRNGESLTRSHRNLAAHLEAEKGSNSVFGTWFDSD